LAGKTPKEKAAIKTARIAELEHRGLFEHATGSIEIVEVRDVEGALEVYVRAFDEAGDPIGFGKNGIVEIERVRIVNPPILVRAPDGDIVQRHVDPVTGFERERRLKEDPTEALRQIVQDAVRLIGKKKAHITKGRVGRTTTVVYSSAGDGSVFFGGSANWNTTHDSASGNGDTDTSSSSYLAATQYFAPAPQFRIDRGFLPFDTSSISSGDTIDSAVVSVYQNSTVPKDVNDANSFIAVVQTRQASTSSLANGDYDECGESTGSGWSNAHQNDIIEGATRRNLSALSTGYNDFTLTATGEGWVARSGETKPTGAASAGYTFLGMREGHDLLDVAYPSTGSALDGLNDISYSEESGTTEDPKLTVEHTNPGITVSPSVLEAEATLHAPTISIINGPVITPDAFQIEATLNAPTVTYDRIFSVGALAAAATLRSVTFVFGQTVLPAVFAIKASLLRISPMWSKRIKPTSNWTPRTKPTTNWTDVV